MEEATEFAAYLIHARRTTLPNRLVTPGPDERQLRLLFEAAASAPDHDQILPWRFIIVELTARQRLGSAFAKALRSRDPLADASDLQEASKEAHRAPLLMLVVVDISPDIGDVPPSERFLSAGCAVQNLLLQAEAMGFGSSLTSHRDLNAPPLREFFGLSASDNAVCFVSLGSPDLLRSFKPRPKPEFFVRQLS